MRDNSSMRFVSAVVLACLGAGCAEGGSSADSGGGDTDAGRERDAGDPALDGGMSSSCPSGQHSCGGGCIDDLANEVDNGCRLGCGEPCPVPPDGAAACGADGRCTFECPPPFRPEGGMCVCTPTTCELLTVMCGAPDNGCGEPLNCGDCDGMGVCTDGRCECPADAREPNESRLSPQALNAQGDSPDSFQVYEEFNMHAAGDNDWFTIRVSDDNDGGNPQITVTLAGGFEGIDTYRPFPAGSDY